MKQYQDFLRHITTTGRAKGDRTGTGTRSVFGYQMRFDLAAGFPLVTSKKVPFRLVVAELLWFLSGSTNNYALRARGCHIWDEWAGPHGELGPIYGHQWRSWPTSHPANNIDQISAVMESIRNNPDSRRHIVSAWNVADIPKMALAPCHAMFQFDVTDGRLSCQLYQRSADAFLGVPFNIASYALLTHMVAYHCGLEVGEFIWTGGDCHIYDNHTEQVATLLSREPRPLPTLHFMRKCKSIFDHRQDDFCLLGYEPHAAIPAPVAV